MKKIFFKVLIGMLALILGLAAWIQISFSGKKYNAPYPDIHASTDSAVIARGKYLAYGPAHCADCHTPLDKFGELEAGHQIPLTGGMEIKIPIGVFRSPNLTPDPKTGIGRLTDAEVARTLRHSVGSDGRLIIDFMPFQNMSDEDLTAVVSFLRSQPPVEREVKKSEFNFLGKAVGTLMGIDPVGPTGFPPRQVKRDSTIEYGRYLTHSVANCRGCHTERDLKTGAFIGKDFAGGFYFEPDAFTKGYSFMSPNLTTDKETGIMANWSETDFIRRFKAGRVHPGSPMAWGAFSRMDTVDLKAIYRYLHSLEPVKNAVGQLVYQPGEKPAK